jgi:hypothetical protein
MVRSTTTKSSVGMFSVPAKIMTRQFLSNSDSYCLNEFARSVRHNVESLPSTSSLHNLLFNTALNIIFPYHSWSFKWPYSPNKFLIEDKEKGVKSDVIKTEREVPLKEKTAVTKWKCKNKTSGCANNKKL